MRVGEIACQLGLVRRLERTAFELYQHQLTGVSVKVGQIDDIPLLCRGLDGVLSSYEDDAVPKEQLRRDSQCILQIPLGINGIILGVQDLTNPGCRLGAYPSHFAQLPFRSRAQP